MVFMAISAQPQCKLNSSNYCPLLILYLTRIAFSALDLTHFAELRDLLQEVQQRDTPSPGGGKQQQVCHRKLMMQMKVISA